MSYTLEEYKKHHSPEPAPTGAGKIVLDEVLKDLTIRSEVGTVKYGTLLRTGNGRDALVDAFQEACDLVMYLKQALIERDEIKPYKAWDYCKTRVCSYVGRKEKCIKSDCTVYEFHQYLKENNQIIEED